MQNFQLQGIQTCTQFVLAHHTNAGTHYNVSNLTANVRQDNLSLEGLSHTGVYHSLRQGLLQGKFKITHQGASSHRAGMWRATWCNML